MNNKKQQISEKTARHAYLQKRWLQNLSLRLVRLILLGDTQLALSQQQYFCVELSTNFHFVPSKVFPVRCLLLLFKYGKFLYSIGAYIYRTQKFLSAPIRGTNSVSYIFQSVSLIRSRANAGQVTFASIRKIFIFVYQCI